MRNAQGPVCGRDVEAALPTLTRIRAHLDAERDEEAS